MRPLTCIIIDDEKPARKLIENYCKKIEDIELIGSFKSPLEALPILDKTSIDLIFLDIQMPEISGIDFMKTLSANPVNIVLTTAYRDYALDGYELNAIDYLLKPIAFHRFLRAVNKVKALNLNSEPLVSTSLEKNIFLKSGKKTFRIQSSDILYIKSENEYIKYVTTKNKPILVLGALKDLIPTKFDKETFIRIHRSYIVNLNHISYVEGHMVCINQELIPIGETYRSAFFSLWS